MIDIAALRRAVAGDVIVRCAGTEVELKGRYDPENVFRVNQNIAPASGPGRFGRAQLDRRALGRG